MEDIFQSSFDYNGESIDELSFEKDERIQIISSDEDWIYGISLKSGNKGWFPSAYGRISHSSAAVESNCLIPCKGNLAKKNITGMYSSWKIRSFYYDGICLNYATPEGTHKGSLVLISPAKSISPEKAKGRAYAIEVSCYKKITGGGHDNISRVLVLAAADEQERQNWIARLNIRLPPKRPPGSAKQPMTELFPQNPRTEITFPDSLDPEFLNDPYLQYGGSYNGDVKDTVDFKYVAFDEMPRFTPEHKSLMAETLTPELFMKLKDVNTSKQYTLSNAIMTGVVTPHLGVGCTAGDEESWDVFKELYYPIIKAWHGYDAYTQKHPMDLDSTKLVFTAEQRALFSKYVVSTRIRAARNISGFSLPAGATEKDRADVERVLEQTFNGLSGELSGTYYKLGELTDVQRDFLLQKGFLFQIPTARNLLTGAGAARSWPDNRGIFHNATQSALAWVNEEDHCRIISMEDGGDIPSVFARFCALSNAVKASAEAYNTRLMWNDTLGFLGTCPSNLGTGLRASVMVHLPCFNKLLEEGDELDKGLLETVCSAFDLQPRGSAGEHSAAVGAKFDISNKQRLGLSEVELVQKMIDGVFQVIVLEELLAAGGSAADVRSALVSPISSPPPPPPPLPPPQRSSPDESSNPFDDDEAEDDISAAVSSSNNPFDDCDDDAEEGRGADAAAQSKAGFGIRASPAEQRETPKQSNNSAETRVQGQQHSISTSVSTSGALVSNKSGFSGKNQSISVLPPDLREFLLMGFKPAVASDACKEYAGAQVMTALDALRKRLRSESDYSSIWASPIVTKISSWIPTEVDADGQIYTAYIIQAFYRWDHYTKWQVMHRNRDFQRLYEDIQDLLSPDQQRRWLPPFPTLGLLVSAMHLGGFKSDAERNKRTNLLDEWLQKLIMAGPLVTMPSVRTLLLAFLEGETQLSAISDATLLSGF